MNFLKNQLLNPGRLARLIEAEAILGNATYTPIEMFGDLRNGLWSELRTGSKIDTYRRNLQRGYLERMEFLMTNEHPRPTQGFLQATFVPIDVSQSDIRPLVRAELKTLRRQVQAAIPRTRDTMSKYHLEDAIVRIDDILDPKN